MLREISASIDERRVRNVLFIIGTLLSAVLGPCALVGAAFGVRTIFIGDAVNFDDLVTGITGFMASAGIAGAWARLSLASERFRRSTRLRSVVAVSLALGILAAMKMAVDSGADAFGVVFGAVGLLGAYLLCATIGARYDAI